MYFDIEYNSDCQENSDANRYSGTKVYNINFYYYMTMNLDSYIILTLNCI